VSSGNYIINRVKPLQAISQLEHLSAVARPNFATQYQSDDVMPD